MTMLIALRQYMAAVEEQVGTGDTVEISMSTPSILATPHVSEKAALQLAAEFQSRVCQISDELNAKADPAVSVTSSSGARCWAVSRCRSPLDCAGFSDPAPPLGTARECGAG